jgi:integrase
LRHAELRRKVIVELDNSTFIDFFAILKDISASSYTRRLIKNDLRMSLVPVLGKLQHSRETLFDGIKIQKPVTRKKKLFNIEALLAKVNDDSLSVMSRAIVGVAITTLRRPCELFALEFSAINFEQSTVSFHCAVRKAPNGKFEVSEGTKNGEESNRVNAVPECIMRLLRQLKEEAGNRKHVFTTLTGLPLHMGRWKRTWPRIKKELDLGKDCDSFYVMKTSSNSYQQYVGVPTNVLRTLAKIT